MLVKKISAYNDSVMAQFLAWAGGALDPRKKNQYNLGGLPFAGLVHAKGGRFFRFLLSLSNAIYSQ